MDNDDIVTICIILSAIIGMCLIILCGFMVGGYMYRSKPIKNINKINCGFLPINMIVYERNVISKPHSLSNHYLDIPPSGVILYEYKIENTIFPNVIENIIKEYIGFRLLWGCIDDEPIFTDYPHKIICMNRICCNYMIPKNNIFYYVCNYNKNRNITEYTIEPEGGFEIFPTNSNELDIKVQ